MRFIAYYRVSTDKPGHSGLGREAQQEAVRAYLKDSGGPPAAEFTEVESGRKAERPELTKALAECRLRDATLIIAKLDHLSRNQRFLMGLVDSGVDIVFCDLPDVPPGAMGRLILQTMASVAEFEAGLISDRTKAALAAAKARGVTLGGFRGYAPTDDDRDKALAARQANSYDWIRSVLPDIRKIQNTGTTSLAGIAKALNERGIKTARKGTWRAVQVQRVIQAAASAKQYHQRRIGA